VFDDMAHYTMVKTTTFNGVPLPAIALWDSGDGSLEVVREFDYEEFRGRLSREGNGEAGDSAPESSRPGRR